MYLRHTHANIYQEVRSEGWKADVEVHSAFAHRATEQPFVRLRKVRQRDVVCGQGSRVDEQRQEQQAE